MYNRSVKNKTKEVDNYYRTIKDQENMIIFSRRKKNPKNVITQYIEINMYNIHAHIERKEKHRKILERRRKQNKTSYDRFSVFSNTIDNT